MMWGYGYGYGWSMLWMVFWNILWLVLLGLLIWTLVRWLNGQVGRAGGRILGPTAPTRTPLEILQERYVRGEIDEATFERMRERIQASPVQGQRQSPEPSQTP